MLGVTRDNNKPIRRTFTMRSLAFVRFARLSIAVAWLFAALAWLPRAAEAAPIQEIFLAGTDTKVGDIHFPSDSGNSAAGVEFSLLGFDEGDITSISWVLDLVTWDVTDLDLQALTGDPMCPGPMLPCRNDTLALTESAFEVGFTECRLTSDGTVCLVPVPISTAIEFRHAVPAPGTLVLCAVALAGLGVVMRRNATG